MANTSRAANDTVLITGAAGFIGSHTACALLNAGSRVVGVDNFDSFYPRQTKQRNLEAIANTDASRNLFSLAELNICDKVAVLDLFERVRPRTVIHLAAKAGVRPSIADPAGYAHTNVYGTSIILDAAHRTGCERVVVASSSSVYGNCPTAPFHEGLDVNAPISPYAATKRACELLCSTHHHLTRQPVACLRFFTVYGPRQRPDLAIASFLGKVSRGEGLEVFGDGSTSRDYTFVSDIVAGILAAAEKISTHGFRIWNLGNSTPITLSEMIATIERVVGKPAQVKRLAMQPGDVERTWADLTRATAELGYAPATTFENGVAAQWKAMQAAAGHS
ncbi:MAG: GDP-mannose 4,6-dehydratase [Planctomycetota bacterium]|nr:GDP-mannose 4,6-dehydratase [Planctomycetota bacterium]